MDELEISGKRYISSRRAGKENKYHADYIGQLIRAKKVEGQKVGRAWYVDAESLAAYLGKEAPVRAPLAPVARVVEKIVEPAAVEEAEAKEEEVVEAEEEEAEVEIEESIIIETTADERYIPVKITAEASPAIYRTTKEAREARTTLRYIADESPLMPHIKKQAPHTIAIRHEVLRPMPLEVVEDVPESAVYKEEIPTAKYALAKKRKIPSLIARAAAMLAIGAIVFAVAAFASTHLLFTVTVDGGQSANAGYGVK
jgi:hypothetical protein